jgi:hypothetical protein
MWITGVCQRIISDTAAGSSAASGLELGALAGMLGEGHQAAAHRVARGVVAADDQQGEVADELVERHVPRRVGMRHHRDQVELGRLRRALLPQLGHGRRP